MESVSAIIPAYNSSSTLERAVDSALRQTVTPLEVIVIDDASCDYESRAITAICERKESVKLIRNPLNRGPADSRNEAWDRARGDWIAFLDSDDAWHPRKLETCLRVARVAQADIVASLSSEVQALEDLGRTLAPGVPRYSVISKRDLLFRNQFSTSSVVVRRSIPLRFGEGRRHAEDYELWLVAVGSGMRIVRIEYPLVGLFKAAYGETGLSAQTAPMIWGELKAYWHANRAGAISVAELCLAWPMSCLRSSVRLMKLAGRRVSGVTVRK